MATASPTSPEVVYAPGACNIGHDEVAYRRKVGWAGVAITVVMAAIFFALSAPFWAFIFTGIPALIAAIGFIQAKENFCVRYADQGTYNVEPGYENSAKVADDADHQADLAKGKAMKRTALLYGAGTGIALAALAALVS